MARHLMEPDPEAAGPPLVYVLWLIVFLLGLVLTVSLVAPSA
jgi:hypothetical protein